MKNQVLSIEQMRELIDMGIDISSASCIWWNFADLGFVLMLLNDGRESITIEKMKENHGAENIVPTFTLNDILELLPKIPDYNLEVHPGYNSLSYITSYGAFHCLCSFEEKTLLQAAFRMLKWCCVNNYL